MSVDLHIHTTASDGTQSPSEVVAEAVAKGLSAIAIADHDTVSGVGEAMAAACGSGVEVFPAVEISTHRGKRELHILAYLVDLENADLVAALAGIRLSRWERGEEIVRRLERLGVDISFDDVVSVTGGDSLGRPHVAAALVARGVVPTLREAFQRYLRKGRPAYVARWTPTVAEALELIGRAGGLAVLAHPGIGRCDGIIKELADCGLGGVEAYHVDHSPAQTARYRQLGEALGLVVTGGSDSHGPGGPTPVEVGQVDVPDECAEALRRWGAARDGAGAPRARWEENAQ